MTGHELDESFDEIRDMLMNAPAVDPRPGALDRIIETVAADPQPMEPVVDLATRRDAVAQRWAPRVAAAAAVITIIGAVVGGVGTDTRIPAVGDLIASHEAAASETMPETAREMPMVEAHEVEPVMPPSMWIEAAYIEAGETVHLLYADAGGGVVSVFRQTGDTDLAELGGAGDVKMMGDSPVWVAEVAQAHVAVIDGDGYVWTVVADHGDDAMMAIMTSELPTRSPSLFNRVLDVADTVAEPWRFGR